jgi:beta-glucuronidase
LINVPLKWVNGEFAVEHEGGHLPFEADVSALVDFGKSNRLSVSVNNVLTNVTVPQGVVEWMYGR